MALDFVVFFPGHGPGKIFFQGQFVARYLINTSSSCADFDDQTAGWTPHIGGYSKNPPTNARAILHRSSVTERDDDKKCDIWIFFSCFFREKSGLSSKKTLDFSIFYNPPVDDFRSRQQKLPTVFGGIHPWKINMEHILINHLEREMI